MSTKSRRSRNLTGSGGRGGSLPSGHVLQRFKFGLLGMLGIAIFWAGFQHAFG